MHNIDIVTNEGTVISIKNVEIVGLNYTTLIFYVDEVRFELSLLKVNHVAITKGG